MFILMLSWVVFSEMAMLSMQSVGSEGFNLMMTLSFFSFIR